MRAIEHYIESYLGIGGKDLSPVADLFRSVELKRGDFLLKMGQHKAMAKKTIKTSIPIQASSRRVWQILTDFEKYPDWNPLLGYVKGEVTPGNRIEILADGQRFKPLVLEYQPERSLRWLGTFLFKGVFDGEHIFRIEDQGDGSVIFYHEENFNGVLVGLMAKKLDTHFKSLFLAMNQKLKELAEA